MPCQRSCSGVTEKANSTLNKSTCNLQILLFFFRHNFLCAFNIDHRKYILKGLPEEALAIDVNYYVSQQITNIMEIALIGYGSKNVIVFNSTHFILKNGVGDELGVSADKLDHFRPGAVFWLLKKLVLGNDIFNISLKLSNVSFSTIFYF